MVELLIQFSQQNRVVIFLLFWTHYHLQNHVNNLQMVSKIDCSTRTKTDLLSPRCKKPFLITWIIFSPQIDK